MEDKQDAAVQAAAAAPAAVVKTPADALAETQADLRAIGFNDSYVDSILKAIRDGKIRNISANL